MGCLVPCSQLKSCKLLNLNHLLVRAPTFFVVQVHQLIGRQQLLQQVHHQFNQISLPELETILNQLCQENQIAIANPEAPIDEQIVCQITS